MSVFRQRPALVLAGWCCLSAGCSSSPKPVQSPQGPTPTVDATQPSSAPVQASVEVAPEPAELVALGRLRAPGPLLDRLGQWSGYPLPWQDLLSNRFPELQRVLLTEAPVDFAVAIDAGTKAMPDVFGVLSFPLADHTRGMNALRASGQTDSATNSGYSYVALEGDVECTVAQASGPAPARLICGNHASLEHLVPFAATNLPQQAVGDSDLYAELRLRPLHARFAKRVPLLKMVVPMLLREGSLQNARFDAALADSAHGVTDDVIALLNEADKLTVKLDLDQRTQETVGEVGFLFRGTKSFLPGLTSHAAQSQSVAPNLFWSLPRQTLGASFTSPAPAFPRLHNVSETLGELLGGALEHAGLASGVVDAWLTEFKSVMTAGGSVVVGHVGGASAAPQTLQAAVACSLTGVENDGGALARLVEATAKMANDPKLRSEVGTRIKQDTKRWPAISQKLGPARLGLPAGTKQYTVIVPKEHARKLAAAQFGAEIAKKQGPLTLSLFVATQGERTWLGWGADETLVVDSLKQALSGPGPESIEQNPVFARWKGRKVVAGSTFRIKDLLAPSLFATDEFSTEAEQLRHAMPHHGESHVHVEVNASTDGPLSAVRLIVPQVTMEDLASLVVSAVTRASTQKSDLEGPVGIVDP